MKKLLVFIMVLFFTVIKSINLWAQCCHPTTTNLVVDGDFEVACGTTFPFSSDMYPQCTYGTEWTINEHPQGVFNIGNGSIQSFWHAGSTQINGSQYFVGDGAWQFGLDYNIAWSQDISVTAGKYYQFAFNYYNESNTRPSPTIAIGYHNAAGTNHFDTGPFSETSPLQGAWLNMCNTYYAPRTETVTLVIYKNGSVDGDHGGNDFGLDNIEFRETYPLSLQPFQNLSVCKGQSITLTCNVLSGSGSYSYYWENTEQTTQSITITPTTSGYYDVDVKDLITNCTDMTEIYVQVLDVNIDLGPDVTICSTSPTVITAYPTSGSGSYSYHWSTGSTAQSISVPYASPGTYSVTVTDNATSCTTSDNIVATDQSCFEGIQYYQNTQSLATLNAHTMIEAGKNVTTTLPTGYVTVLDGQNVTFQAGRYVDLEPGFSTSVAGATSDVFLAYIKPGCYFDGLSISQTYNAGSHCNFNLVANTQMGSGNYTYSWSNGATTKSINLNTPATTTTYTVTVTDQCLGTVGTASYTVEPNYVGDFTLTIPNLVTKNGDGINDTWVVTDSEDPGKTQYAYNAYYYKFTIQNIWGSTLYTKSGTESFASGDINWPATGISDGGYWYWIILANCTHISEYKGWIHVLTGSSSRLGVASPSDTAFASVSSISQTNGLVLFPNPSNDRVEIMAPLDMTTFSVAVEDGNGREIFKQGGFANNNSIDLSNFQPGIYYVRIFDDKRGYGSKFVKK